MSASDQKGTGKGEWDIVLEAQGNWFNTNLKDLWRYRDLVLLFVKRDFVAVYKQTVLGPLWYIIQPVLTSLMFALVFSRIAKLPTSGLPPFLFYLSGIVIWNFFAMCLNKTSNTFVNNVGIFGKVYFPRLAVPVSVVISNMISFFIQFLLFLGVYLYYSFNSDAVFEPNVSILLLPWLLLIMAGLGLGTGIIISSLTTKYRDFTHLVGFGVQLLMYATPVIYPSSILPERFRFLVDLNPMAPVIETFRYAFFGQGMFSYPALMYSSVFTLVVLVIGVVVFSKVERNFMDTV